MHKVVWVAHPFFDSTTFPWHLSEASELHVILYKSITTAGQIDLIRQACGPTVKPVAVGGPDAMWRDVLDAVAVAGCLKNLEQRLRCEQTPHVIAALDKLLHLLDTSLDPGVGEQIFVNRIGLRHALRLLTAANTPKHVLVVRGESQSGKSWTRHIIEHYARMLGQGCSYLCEGLVSNSEEVLEFIFAELGGQVPARLTTEDAWFRKAAADMLKLASARNRGTWIVMDDLGVGSDGAPLLDQQIRGLFDQLAVSMQNPAFAKWFRLVLISYPEGPLPDKWRRCSVEDRTAVADIHPAAVTEFLAGWARRNSKMLAVSDAERLAEDIIDRAIASADAIDGRSHMERVHDELYSTLGKL